VARNLELKARCRSLATARSTARALGARYEGVLHQVDTYFDVPSGRLKLREFRGRQPELIFYDRPSTADDAGRWSSYLVYPVRDVRQLKAVLVPEWPVRAIVRKQRQLFLLQNARIHLDNVKGLGSFIEFEVMLTSGRGQAEALYRRLREGFDIRPADLVGGSYVDLFSPLRRTRSLAILDK
jgi:adenylate cyclase class IV